MLTAAACLALVGTASAAWVYAGTATASANIGVKVAAYASAGKITVEGADNYYLYLDKGSVAFKQKVEGTDLIATHDTSEFDTTTTSAKNVTYTYTVTLKGWLAEWVEFAENNSDTWTDYDDEMAPSYRTTTDRTWVSGEAITLPTLKWATDSDSGTTHDDFSDVESYKSIVKNFFDIDLEDDFDQNAEIDVAADLGYVKIDFKAVVANS